MHNQRAQSHLVAGLVLSVGVALRVWAAWRLPLQEDEAASLLERSWSLLMTDEERYFNPVPWRAFTVWLTSATDDLVLQRLPSALLGGGAAAWAALHVGRARGWSAGSVAGLGLACAPWLVRQHGQLRSYGLAMFASVAVAIALDGLLKRDGARQRLVLAIAIGAAGWAHFALLVWAPIGLVALLMPRTAPRAGGGGNERTALSLVVLGALLASPLQLAWTGAQMKAAAPAHGLLQWREFSPVWHPDVALAAALAVGLALRLCRAGIAPKPPFSGVFAAIALGVGGVWVVLAEGLGTARWDHLVAWAPAAWIAAAGWVAGSSPRAQRLVATVVAGGALMTSAALGQALEEGATRQDDAVLAAHLRAHPVKAWIIESERGPTDSRAIGVAHALGYYRGGPDRCVGPDVMHAVRCRKRVVTLAGQRGACVDGRCVLPIRDAPRPLASAAWTGPGGRATWLHKCPAGGDKRCVQVGRWSVVAAPPSGGDR